MPLLDEVSLDELSRADTVQSVPSNWNIKHSFTVPMTCLPQILFFMQIRVRRDCTIWLNSQEPSLLATHIMHYAQTKLNFHCYHCGIKGFNIKLLSEFMGQTAETQIRLNMCISWLIWALTVRLLDQLPKSVQSRFCFCWEKKTDVIKK